MRWHLSLSLLLLPLCLSRAQIPGFAIKTTHLGGPSGGLTSPSGIYTESVRMGNVAYFGAGDGAYGYGGELWRSDGTPEGTRMVKDIYPGPSTGGAGNLVVAGDRLYFIARTKEAGIELWRSDGTAEGTRMVRDLTAGAADSTMEKFTVLGTRLFFRMSTAATGMELWTSDGTSAGTTQVRDINGGTASSSPDNFVPAGQWMYFTATTAANGTELWRTDGTLAGTTLVKDILSGTGSSTPTQPVLHNGLLYFAATTNAEGMELWRSDGTAAGTVLVKDIVPGTTSSSPGAFVSAGGKLYFSAIADNLGREPYVSDGTSASTNRLKDINAGTRSSYASWFTEAAGTVFFIATDYVPETNSGRGDELWKTDGTEAGTVLVKDIVPGSAASNPRDFIEWKGKLWFRAGFSNLGTEPAFSDGTEAGTGMLKDTAPGIDSGAFYKSYLPLNDWLLFAVNLKGDTELWRTDGTAEGTTLLKDINRDLQFHDGEIGNSVMTAGTKMIFSAYEPATGREYWSTDGTPGGTGLMKDFVAGPDENQLHYPMVTGPDGLAYLVATDDLWRSDGTTAGTVQVMTQRLQWTGILSPTILTPFRDSIFFTALYGSNHSRVLHRYWTDSGSIGTPLGLDRDPVSMRLSGNRLFINIIEGPGNYRLGEISPETMLPSRIFDPQDTTIPATSPQDVEVLSDGRIIMTASTPATGGEIWMTSGAPGTTYMIKDIRPGTAGGREDAGVMYTTPDNKAFFIADDGVHSRELWVTDGTAAGTNMMKDINPGNVWSNYEFFEGYCAVLENRLIFSAESPVYGRELWVSDGTPAGTIMLKDIMPGTGSSGIDQMRVWRGRVWFAADDGVNGDELWMTDGTPAGTKLAADVNPGPFHSHPRFTAFSDDRFYFAAGDMATSREHVWLMELLPVPSLDEWATAAGLSGENVAPLAYPAGDGVANLLKYAFNLNPAAVDRTELKPGAATGLPVVTRDLTTGQPRLAITWLQRRNAFLTYTPVRSPDMQAWFPVPGTATVTPVNEFWEQRTIFATLLPNETTRHYGAVRVTMTPQ